MTTANIQPAINSNPFEVFNHPAFGFVRVVVKDGEPWFVGKDVAEVLGYKDSVNALKKHVDEEDKELFKGGETPPLNLNYGAIIINEGGLYSLMLRSKLPQAKDFKRWVTSEVLPKIRKHGGYLTNWTLLHGAVHLVHFVHTFPLVCSNNSSKGFHI